MVSASKCKWKARAKMMGQEESGSVRRLLRQELGALTLATWSVLFPL